MLLLSAFVGNGCVAVYYPDDYYTWPEERRIEWREHHSRHWNEYYTERRHEERQERREHHDRD
jgi:hypothetical protein